MSPQRWRPPSASVRRLKARGPEEWSGTDWKEKVDTSNALDDIQGATAGVLNHLLDALARPTPPTISGSYEVEQEYELNEPYLFLAATNPSAVDMTCVPFPEAFHR